MTRRESGLITTSPGVEPTTPRDGVQTEAKTVDLSSPGCDCLACLFRFVSGLSTKESASGAGGVALFAGLGSAPAGWLKEPCSEEESEESEESDGADKA